MDKVFEIVKNIGEWLEMGKNVKEWYGYHSGLEESMKNLKRKMEYLSAQENDINKQISSAEHRPWKKRKVEVEVWLRDEQQMENEVQRLEQEVVGEINLFSRVQLGKRIIEKIQEVEKLQEKGRAFDGLLVDDFPTVGILMPPTKDFVESTEARNMERVWECLMKEDVGQIGVYGMGGIGKTTIMKHIHNRILKETIRARELYATVLSKFPGQEHTYLSYDETTNITQQGMAPTHMNFSEIKPGTKYYRTSGMVIEKALPHTLGKTTTIFQRIVLQNSKGEKMQAGIYGSNINILQKNLKLYHCYSITNATVALIPESYQYLEIPYQLTLSAKTPIEEVQIDGLTMRSLKYNFAQLSDLEHITESGPKIDVLFAILEVGARRKPKNSWVADVRVIDQSLRPTTITLWDQFSDIEAREMANLPGTFPIVIGLHLRIASYYGIGLGTHNSTIFILNPPTPQAAALQTWCLKNAEKIKALPLTGPDKKTNIALTMPDPDEIVNIIDLPASVDKPEMWSVKAVIRVADLNQRFYYLACSLCKATTASRDHKFFCNYCNERVPALPKIKFQVKLSDLTDSIDAMVFKAVSEQYYGITGKDIDTSAMDGSLSLPLLEKLSQPKDCTIRLRAEMNDYGGLNQCKFIVQAIFDSP